jgi:dihydrofolate reductase
LVKAHHAKTFRQRFLGTSIDGCIAGEDGDLSWLADLAPDSPEATGYTALMAQVDTLLIGRTTYDAVLGFEPWPYAGKRVLVSHRDFIRAMAKSAAKAAWQRCWRAGGRRLPPRLPRWRRRHPRGLREGVIDSLTLSVLPVVLGKGVRLFEDGLPRSDWRLEGAPAAQRRGAAALRKTSSRGGQLDDEAGIVTFVLRRAIGPPVAAEVADDAACLDAIVERGVHVAMHPVGLRHQLIELRGERGRAQVARVLRVHRQHRRRHA